MHRRLIALDETCVSVNGLKYWVYAAIDVDRNEILSMSFFSKECAHHEDFCGACFEVL